MNCSVIQFGSSFTVMNPSAAGQAKKLELIWVNPGTFLMGGTPHFSGSELSDTPFLVTISNGYWIGKYPVTQAQWHSVFQENPSGRQVEADAPVEMIDWQDACLFCSKINEMLVRSIPDGYVFSLPTEAQWEYACRAETETRFNTGPTEFDLAKGGWYTKNSSGHTHPVGEKQPNKWNFYDFHGNVFEWCADWAADYPASATQNWEGGKEGIAKIIRGGAFGTNYSDGTLCSSGRGYVLPDTRCGHIGMRLSLKS